MLLLRYSNGRFRIIILKIWEISTRSDEVNSRQKMGFGVMIWISFHVQKMEMLLNFAKMDHGICTPTYLGAKPCHPMGGLVHPHSLDGTFILRGDLSIFPCE